MSSETCVYILVNRKNNGAQEYRVALSRAVDNEFFRDREWIFDTFANCLSTASRDMAITHADHLDRENQTEYGVSLIRSFEDQSFEILEKMQ